MSEQPYSADQLMKRIYIQLARDFQSSGGLDSSCSSHCMKLMCDEIRAFRELPNIETNEGSDDAYSFKCAYQLNSLFKRWIFSPDVHTAEDLIESSKKKFLDNQDRLTTFAFPSVQSKAFWAVANLARRYIAKVLGVYSVQEHLELCRFGSRATVGVPLSKASEAQRWAVPITGSTELIEWFHFHVVSGGQRVEDYLESQRVHDDDLYTAIDSLAVTFVPKKFDSLRSIVANSTIGNYHSSGLGKMMERRLKRAGYDISKLQDVHRRLAEKSSLDGKLVTCDQSLASDNITRQLVALLLPRDWFRELDRGRIGKYQIQDQTYELEMFCGMGIGFTFPLQTLIFLSLLKAIVRYYHLGKVKISAYGDDLVYSRSLHKYVIEIFPQFGLMINESKTFSEGRFRESCGGDYFAGVDVRPFQPQKRSAENLGKKSYLALLHKTINGLCLRWDVEDIPTTLSYLLNCCEEEFGVLMSVPSDYPDFAGIKECYLDRMKYSDTFTLETVRITTPKWKFGVPSYLQLGVKPKYKKEHRHEPFLWSRIRQVSNSNTDHSVPNPAFRSGVSRRIERICRTNIAPELITWKREVVRKGGEGKKRKLQTRVVPVIAAFNDDTRYEVTQVYTTPKKN